MQINSRDNSLLRQVRAVRDGKIEELIYVEGLRLCEEALRSQLTIEAVIVSEELLRKERIAGVIRELSQAAKRFASLSEKLLASVSYTKTPQGIIVLAQRPPSSEARLAARTCAGIRCAGSGSRTRDTASTARSCRRRSTTRWRRRGARRGCTRRSRRWSG